MGLWTRVRLPPIPLNVLPAGHRLTDDGCNGAPDWIVDLMNLRVIVYNFEHDTFEEYTFSDKVRAGLYEDLEIDFSKVCME